VAENDEPVDVYVTAYADESAAREDWDAVRALVQDKVITVEALVLVSRDLDGKIHVKEDAHNIRVGTAIGAVGGSVVGVLLPPALVASAVVGAGIGAGTGALVNQVQKHRIKSDVEDSPGVSVQDQLVVARREAERSRAAATVPMLRPRRSATRSRTAASREPFWARCTASTAAQRTSRLPCLVIRPRRTVVSDS
jgi:uncharacterized membrane protein